MTAKPLYIFDLDGTLATIEHRKDILQQKDDPNRWSGVTPTFEMFTMGAQRVDANRLPSRVRVPSVSQEAVAQSVERLNPISTTHSLRSLLVSADAREPESQGYRCNVIPCLATRSLASAPSLRLSSYPFLGRHESRSVSVIRSYSLLRHTDARQHALVMSLPFCGPALFGYRCKLIQPKASTRPLLPSSTPTNNARWRPRHVLRTALPQHPAE